MHTREKIIYERMAHIRRKKRILKYVYGEQDTTPWGGDGALSKGKIHCSCPMCAQKTNHASSLGDDSLRNGGKNWKISDLRKLAKGSLQ